MSVRKEFCEPRLTPISPRISHVLKGDGRLDLAQAPRHGHPTLGTEKSASSGDAADQVTMARSRHRFPRPMAPSHSHPTVPHPRFGCNRQNKSPKNGYVPLQASKQAIFHLNDGIAAIPTPAMVAIMPLYLSTTMYSAHLLHAWRPLGAPTDPYDRCAYWSTRVRLFRYLCVSTN